MNAAVRWLLLFSSQPAAIGTLDVTLGAITTDAQGVVGDAPVEGTLSVTLGAITLSATGTAEARGTLSKTLDPVTVSATGVSEIRGTATVTLGAITSSATATSTISGTLTVTLGLTLSATGGVEAQGQLAVTLGPITLVGFEAPPWVYGDTVVLVDITLTAARLSGAQATVGAITSATLTDSELDEPVAA